MFLSSKCKFDNCTFISYYISLTASNNIFYRCIFNQHKTINNVYADFPNNSAQFNLNDYNNGIKLFIEFCEIYSSLDTPIFSISNTGKNNNYIIIRNSIINKTNNSKIGLPLGKLYLDDVTISSDVEATITSLGNSIFKNIILKNVTIKTTSTDIIENISIE